MLVGYVRLNGLLDVLKGMETSVPPLMMVRFEFCVLQRRQAVRVGARARQGQHQAAAGWGYA
jgi:hypothetical protein